MTQKEQAVEQIKQLIPIYKLNKTELDSYKKLCDNHNAQIKSLMVEYNLKEVSQDGIKVTCTTSKREEFIEEALISKLKELKVKGVIKKKEYVDMDALENAIYNGDINAADLASCQSCKEVVTLRLVTSKK